MVRKLINQVVVGVTGVTQAAPRWSLFVECASGDWRSHNGRPLNSKIRALAAFIRNPAAVFCIKQ